MKFKIVLAVAALATSGVASAQLPSLTLSVVGQNIPMLGNLGIQNLVLGGPTLIVPPTVVRPGADAMPMGAPSLSLSLVGGNLPLLPDLGVENLVLGGPQGFEFPLLIGTTDLVMMVGPLLEGLPGLPGFNGSVPLLDALPGIDILPVGPELVLQFVDPSIVGGVLEVLGELGNGRPPSLDGLPLPGRF